MPRVKQPSPEAEKTAQADKQIREAVGNTNQEQIDRRNAIADRADEARAAELQDVDGDKLVLPDPEEARAEREAQEAEQERARLEAEANEAEAKALQEGEKPRTYTVRVNGRDVEMTEAELMARAAKVASADEYLQMAQDAVKRAQALGPSQDVPASEDDALTEDTLTSFLQGDREAIRKVAQHMKRPSGPTPDVLQAVDARVAFLREVDRFEGSFQDLKKDPRLWRMVVEEDKRLAETEPTLSYKDRLSKAGNTIRTWMSGLSKESPGTPNPKLVRKASTPPVPSAGGRQSVPRDEEDEEPVENVIDAMAKARGQGQAIRTPQGMFGTPMGSKG